MKNKNLLIIIISIILLLISVLFYSNISNRVIVEKFDLKVGVVKKIKIEDKEKIKEIKNITKNIKHLSSEEYVDLAILPQYNIKIGLGTTIRVNLNEKEYCLYKNIFNKEELAKLPNGLLEWLNYYVEK